MKKSVLFFVMLSFGITSSCSDSKQVENLVNGVWANADCELLRTDHFALFFERADSSISATLYRMSDGDTTRLGNVLFTNNAVIYKDMVSEEEWTSDDMNFGTITESGELLFGADNKAQTLKRIENIELVEPYEMLNSTPMEIGSCVQQWQLGVRRGLSEDAVTFEAGTNRHSYAFIIQNNFVYCRAARLRFNDLGGLFAQNIRLMSNEREYTCEMAPNNLETSAAELQIDNSKFNPDGCVFDKEGIYWSFIRFDGQTAVLNGCGEIYRFDRPDTSSHVLEEWIAFNKY